jgi:hypothetical protein
MTTMSPRDFLRELAYPASSSGTLIALITFMLLISLASAAGMLGIWLAIAVIPAYLRYLTMIAEARARGRDASPPGIEYFTLVGNAWTLFPVVPVVLLGVLVVEAAQGLGAVAALVVALFGAPILPAIIGVLVITHSPVQSIDPRAIVRFIRGCGLSYAYAPLAAVLVVAVPMMLAVLPAWTQLLLEVYLLAAFFAVMGAVTRGAGLIDDVDVPQDTEPGPDATLMAEVAERTRVLNHAYGFVSRGNRDGGLEHIYASLLDDPDPDEAWRWYLEQMLRWEDAYPALLLAQQYLGRLLEHGDQVGAVKLMLRCGLVDAAFRPLTADLPRAIAAAQACDNRELVAALSRGR